MSAVFPVTLKDQIGKGGFAVVFRDPRDPKNRCIKQFKEPLTGDRASFIRHLGAVEHWARPSEVDQIKSTYSWPLEIFGDEDMVAGYTMPLAPEDAYITLRAAGRDQRRLLELSFLTVKNYFNKAAISSSAPEFGDQDRLELAISVCDAILTLHDHHLVYRDVSARNMTARLTTPRAAFILDADSISTTDFAEANFIMSPGWGVSTGLDPLEVDRAKLALLVLRLLIQDNDAYPPTGLDELDKRGRRALAQAISLAYSTATADATKEMVTALRRARASERSRHAWEAAVRSGFARRILREASAASTPAEYEILRKAKLHVDAEAQIEAADLKVQKKLVSRLSRTSSFSHDLLPSVGLMPPPRSLHDLHQLAFDAQFVDLAAHLVKSDLGPLGDDSLIPALADRALFESERPHLDVTTNPGNATIRIHWPRPIFCNALQIELNDGINSPVNETVIRDTSNTHVLREIRSLTGGKLYVSLRPGVRTLHGKTFFSFQPLVHREFDIPPVPKPPIPQARRSSIPVGHVQLFDPEEEERKRVEEVRLRKRRFRKKVLITTTLLLVGLAGASYWLANDEAKQPPSGTMIIYRH